MLWVVVDYRNNWSSTYTQVVPIENNIHVNNEHNNKKVNNLLVTLV